MIYTFEDLYKATSRYLGNGLNPTGDDLELAQGIVNRGYNRALQHYDWSFTQRNGQLKTVVNQSRYSLSDDFINLINTKMSHISDSRPDVTERSAQQVQTMHSQGGITTSNPLHFAIYPADYGASGGSKWMIQFYPVPSEQFDLIYSYKFSVPKLTNAEDAPVGGDVFAPAIHACCLAQTELEEDEKIGAQEATAQRALADAVNQDKKRAPKSLGTTIRYLDAHPQRNIVLEF